MLSGAEEARYAALGVISGFFRPIGLVGDMGGGSLEVAEVAGRPGRRALGQPAARRPAGARRCWPKAPARPSAAIDALLEEGLPPALTEPVFYAVGGGWRALRQGAHGGGRGAGAGGARLHARRRRGARVRQEGLAPAARRSWRRCRACRRGASRTLPAAALVLDRVLKHLAPERVVFSALGLREGWLYAQLARDGALSRPAGRGRAAVRPAAWRACRPSRRPWRAGPTACSRARRPADRRLRVAACALSDIAWRDHADVRAEESFRRLLQFPFIGLDHAERVFLAAAIHARYAGSPTMPGWTPAIGLLPPSARRRAQILGRAMLLGYRLSGGVPEILDGRACASSPTWCASRSAAPRACPTARSSATG